MASTHLNTTGSVTSPFETWAKANTAPTVTGLSAGDYLLVDSAYNTVQAGISLTFPGTPSSPNIVHSGTPGATSGETAYVAGALFASSTTTATFNGSYKARGITFQAQSASSHDLNIGTASGNCVTLDDCKIRHTGAGGSSTITMGSLGSGTGGYINIRNSTIKFASTGQTLALNQKVDIDGLTVESGSSNPTNFITVDTGGHAANIDIRGLDLTNFTSWSGNIFAASTYGGNKVKLRDVTFPAAGSPNLTGALKAGDHIEMWNYGSGSTSYKFWIEDYCYTAKDNTSIYVTGSSVSGQALSYKVDTSANCSVANVGRLYLGRVALNQTSGSYTEKVLIARDGSATAFLDSELYTECEYLGTSGKPMGVNVNDACDLLTQINSGGTAQASDSTPWTGLGGTNVTQKLDVVLNPKFGAYVDVYVCFVKASITAYVHPIPSIPV